MKRNVIVLGDRTLTGDYGRILSAGEARLTSGSARVIRSAGELRLSHCRVEKVRSVGELDAQDSELIQVRSTGAAQLKGICCGDTWSVQGSLEAESLKVRLLCGSEYGQMQSLEWKGVLQGETLELAMPCQMACDLEYRQIILSAPVSFGQEVVCDRCYCLSGITAPGINAETIFLLNSPDVQLDYLEGSYIRVAHQFTPDRDFEAIAKQQRYKGLTGSRELARVRNVEGDRVELAYTRAEQVNGADVVIGPMCVIDRVAYSGSIQIDDKAMIGEVVRL